LFDVEGAATRQEILELEDGPRLWAIIDESALRREVGGRALMLRQYEHLLRMHRHPRVVIQVIPNAAGICCATGRPFSLLSFRHQSDLVYLEDLGSARYIRERDEVSRYALTFDRLRASALADDESAKLIGVMIKHDR
jgi:Domain of unknown function (DUF5753)